MTLTLPADGVFTRSAFDRLQKPPDSWAWELRDGRLELTYMRVSFWRSRIMLMLISFWLGEGHEAATEQYVADSGFAEGGTGRNNRVADGVVFVKGHRPHSSDSTHSAQIIHAAIEAVSSGSEERDSIDKLKTYAALGIHHYWIVREIGPEVDGLISMYELRGGEYELIRTVTAAELRK
jgi:Uma2 family endonuclease